MLFTILQICLLSDADSCTTQVDQSAAVRSIRFEAGATTADDMIYLTMASGREMFFPVLGVHGWDKGYTVYDVFLENTRDTIMQVYVREDAVAVPLGDRLVKSTRP